MNTEYFVTGKASQDQQAGDCRVVASSTNGGHVQITVTCDELIAACELDADGIKELMVALEQALKDAAALEAQRQWDERFNWEHRDGSGPGRPPQGEQPHA